MKEAKAAEAKATGKKNDGKDCVECARDERKKKEKITKYVNERYDAKFKEIQNATNGTNSSKAQATTKSIFQSAVFSRLAFLRRVLF